MPLYFNPCLAYCDISGRISLTILIPRLLLIFSDPKRLERCERDTWETGCNNLEIYYINKHWPCQLDMHARVWNWNCSHENREIEHFLQPRLLLCNQTDIFTSLRCLCLVGNSLLIGRRDTRGDSFFPCCYGDSNQTTIKQWKDGNCWVPLQFKDEIASAIFTLSCSLWTFIFHRDGTGRYRKL